MRFFLRSSVSRSAFIWALRSVTPGQLVSSMSLAASGSNWKAAKMTSLGRRAEGFGFLECAGDLALFERSVLGAEGDDGAAGESSVASLSETRGPSPRGRGERFGFGVGVEVARAA